MCDGRRKSDVVAHNRGRRGDLMTRDDAVGRCHACARSLSVRRRRGIVDMVLAPETAESVEEVVSACV